MRRPWPRRLAAAALAGLLAACHPASHPTNHADGEDGTRAAAAGASEDHAELCEHRVPAALCTQCHPELAEVFKETGDWCAAHGVPESHCFKCNPDLSFEAGAAGGHSTAAGSDWCAEHSLPESKCTKCNPELIARFIEANDYCREHGFPESVCPVCHPELVRAAGKTPPVEAPLKTRVRLASGRTVAEAGIETMPAELRRVTSSLEVVGRLEYDRNRLAQMSSRGEAVIREMKVDIGDDVAKGESLASLASASVGEGQAQLTGARAQLKAAKATFDRESALARKGISPRQTAEEAQAAVARAQAEYDAIAAGLGIAGGTEREADGTFSLVAPFAGTVVARHGVVGRMVSANEVLVEVADLATMWAALEIPEADAARVKAGQPVSIAFEGSTLEPLEATITRVGSEVGESTRTVQARVELANPDRSLKAGAFVRAAIKTSPPRDALVVPRSSIQTAEGRSVVFVQKAVGLFEPVTVQVGATHGEHVEITGDVAPGTPVVTTGAFLLKTEISKESIGAGCCEGGE